jgi:hypothetical protein
MPRRNLTPARRRRMSKFKKRNEVQAAEGHEKPLASRNFETIARRIVERGNASPLILDRPDHLFRPAAWTRRYAPDEEGALR